MLTTALWCTIIKHVPTEYLKRTTRKFNVTTALLGSDHQGWKIKGEFHRCVHNLRGILEMHLRNASQCVKRIGNLHQVSKVNHRYTNNHEFYSII